MDKIHRSTWYPTHGLEKQPNNMDLENHMTLNSIVLNTENDIPNPPYSRKTPTPYVLEYFETSNTCDLKLETPFLL